MNVKSLADILYPFTKLNEASKRSKKEASINHNAVYMK